MRHVSLACLTVMDADPPAVVSIAAAAGYQGISLAAGARFLPAAMDPGTRIDSVIDDVSLRRETMRRAADTGVRLDMLEGLILSPDLTAAKWRMALDVMQEMGVKQLATFDSDPDRGRAADQLAALCESAQAREIGVCIEFHSRSQLRSIAAAAHLVDQGRYPGLKILVDALHLARGGETPEDVSAVAFQSIGCAQFCDAPAASTDAKAYRYEAMFERQIPGDGELPLAALLDAIPSDCIVYLEVPQRAARERGVSALERAQRALDGMRRLEAQQGTVPIST
jgi:sugar phosphate isomerase/epimerase